MDKFLSHALKNSGDMVQKKKEMSPSPSPSSSAPCLHCSST